MMFKRLCRHQVTHRVSIKTRRFHHITYHVTLAFMSSIASGAHPDAAWSFSAGPPVPNHITTRELAEHLGAAFDDQNVTAGLKTTFTRVAALTCGDLKEDSVTKNKMLQSLPTDLDADMWVPLLRKWVFGTAGDFADEPTPTNLLVTSTTSWAPLKTLSNQVIEPKGGFKMKSYCGREVAPTDLVGNHKAWTRFQFPEPTRAMLKEALAGKVDETATLNIIYKVTIVVFESNYLDQLQKLRYATLLNGMNSAISIDAWCNSLMTGFNNRRQGRFVKPLFFNSTDVKHNGFLEQVADRLPGKIGVSDEEPALLGYEPPPDVHSRVADLLTQVGTLRVTRYPIHYAIPYPLHVT